MTAVWASETAIGKEQLYRLAAAAEASSEHPLGKAVVRGFQQLYGTALPRAEQFHMIVGSGVTACIEGRDVRAGNESMMEAAGTVLSKEAKDRAEEYIAQGSTIIYVAVDSAFAGFLALTDTVRRESAAMMQDLTRLGVQPVLLTGDNENAAKAIASQLGIQDVHAQCLPEDKLRHIRDYQNRQERICMIGDGINDAPSLKQSDVGIAMGGIGSDIAIDAADIVLVDDEVKELPHLVALSKRMMFTIKCNLTFSMTLNFIAVALAMFGILNPVVGALVHNAGSVIVIVNSAFLLKWNYNS